MIDTSHTSSGLAHTAGGEKKEGGGAQTLHGLLQDKFVGLDLCTAVEAS